MGKITEEELAKIGDIKKEVTALVSVLGELEYQRLAIQLNVEEIKDRIKDIRKSESEILGELRSKYGNVNINIDTGEFS